MKMHITVYPDKTVRISGQVLVKDRFKTVTAYGQEAGEEESQAIANVAQAMARWTEEANELQNWASKERGVE